MATEPEFQPAEVFPIDDLDTLKLLMTEPRIEIIELLRNPASVAELADRMDVPRTRLYHHINTLEKLGAIVVVDARRAGAMTEKIYQVAAKSYQPSDKFVESATPREQAVAAIDSLFSITRTDMIRAVEAKQFDLGTAQKQRRVTMTRTVLTLTPQRINELLEGLESLIDEFSDPETDETEPLGVLIIAHPSSRNTT